jgi:hypothetical protein
VTPPPVIATPVTPPAPEPPIVDAKEQARQAEEQEQQRQGRLQAEQFLEQAQRARQEGALSMSLIHIEQGLQAMPSHPDLLSLKRDVLKQQADLQRQEETARRQEEAAHQQATALEQAKAESQQRQRKADELLARALDDQRNRSYETSLLRIEQGLQQMPDHRRLLALREDVRKQLREAKAAPPPAYSCCQTTDRRYGPNRCPAATVRNPPASQPAHCGQGW